MIVENINSQDYKPVNILQAYRIANEIAKKSSNLDDEIAAFNQVVELGLNQRNLSGEDSIKSNMIMYWAYNNLGEAFAKKENHRNSLKYYEQGLHFARDNMEKISILNKMAHNYLYLKEDEKWLNAREKIIEYLKDEDKRRAYTALAEELQNNHQAAQMYEKALEYVNDEELSLLAKCQNTLQICERLMILYKGMGDQGGYQRIAKLADKTAILAVKTLEERIDNEDERAKKIDSFVKLIEVENKFLNPDDNRKGCIYHRLADMLNKDEIVKVEGKSYSKAIIKKLLQ